MIKYCYLFLAVFFQANLHAQSDQGIDQLNDDFMDANSIPNWKTIDQAEGWPNKLNKLVIENGQLIMEPGTSGWFSELQGPFLFKEVNGDFDVTARVKSSGSLNEVSKTLWSLGGLMVRVPKRRTKDTWQPKEETWLFINTGIAQEKNKSVIESKYTLNSKSSLKLRDGKPGWITLRIVRVGNSFITMYKYDGTTNWVIQDRYYIADLPDLLQVGFQCYTNSESVSPQIRFGDPVKFNSTVFNKPELEDMRLTVDFIKFKRPSISFSSATNRGETWYNNVSKNNLTDYSLSNEKLIQLLEK